MTQMPAKEAAKVLRDVRRFLSDTLKDEEYESPIAGWIDGVDAAVAALEATPPADAALADDETNKHVAMLHEAASAARMVEAHCDADELYDAAAFMLGQSVTIDKLCAALRARAVPEGKKYHDVAQRLYALLDDIDTAGDIAKSDDKLYRGIVERTQAKKRDFVVSCDGYTVTLADDSMLTASKEGESS